MITEFNFIPNFGQLLCDFRHGEGVVQVAIRGNVSRRLFVTSTRVVFAHGLRASETNRVFQSTKQGVFLLEHCLNKRHTASHATANTWKWLTGKPCDIRACKNVTKPVCSSTRKRYQRVLASKRFPRLAAEIDEPEILLCCNLQVENRQSRAVVKMLLSYSVASSMLNIFHCVCFAYVIIHLLVCDWLLGAGRGRWL